MRIPGEGEGALGNPDERGSDPRVSAVEDKGGTGRLGGGSGALSCMLCCWPTGGFMSCTADVDGMVGVLAEECLPNH